MVQQERIKALGKRIARAFRPKKIVLFGSYAYGKPRRDSDVDLLVIMPFSGHAAYQSLKIRRAMNPDFALDLVVRTPQDVRSRLRQHDGFLKEVMEHGQVLYRAPGR